MCISQSVDIVVFDRFSANKIYYGYAYYPYITADLCNRFLLYKLIRDPNASDAFKQ